MFLIIICIFDFCLIVLFFLYGESTNKEMPISICIATDTYACRDNPCKNGGTCNDLTDYYNCTCTASYTGKRCETGINDYRWIKVDNSSLYILRYGIPSHSKCIAYQIVNYK